MRFSKIIELLRSQKQSFLPFAGVVLLSVLWMKLPDQGLLATYYYRQNWEGTPVLSKIERQPDLSTIIWGVNFIEGDMFMRMRDFSILWDGWIRIDDAGKYGFTIDAVNPCALRIDDMVVLTHDGNFNNPDMVSRAVSAHVELSRGIHKINLAYSQDSVTFTQLQQWRQDAEKNGIPIVEQRKKIKHAYTLSLQWTPPGQQERVIPQACLTPAPLSDFFAFAVRHLALFRGVYLLVFAWLLLSACGHVIKPFLADFAAQFDRRRMAEGVIYILWCVPSGIIFLGIKGIIFVGFLYLTGRPLSVALKRQCFLLERITLSIALSVVFFAFFLSGLLHFTPLYSAFFVAVCGYGVITFFIALWNWNRKRVASDTIGSRKIYAILLLFAMFICLISSNIQVGMEESVTGNVLLRIINHDVSYWGYKYSSILYDALIYLHISKDAPIETLPEATKGVASYAVPPYYARAVTMLSIHLYLMTIISLFSLFVPYTFAVIFAALTYYFFSASLGTYTFFTLYKPLVQFSHNYALVQYPNLFFATLLPLYGLWRRSKFAIVLGFLALAFLPASQPAYFIIIIAPVLLFPLLHVLARRRSPRSLREDRVWKQYYSFYAFSAMIALCITVVHGSFLREFLYTVLKIPTGSKSTLWGYIFLEQPQYRITFSGFITKYRLDFPLHPLWHPENMSAFPVWIFVSVVILPYLYKFHRVFFFLVVSMYVMTGIYLAKGLPVRYIDNVLDIYQPFDVLFHVVMPIASYSLMEIAFYNKTIFRSTLLIRKGIGALFIALAVITGVNTFFMTGYVRLTYVEGAYFASVFHYNVLQTLQQSSALYAYAFKNLW